MNLYERRKKKLLYATNLFFLKDNLIALAGAKDMIDSIVRTEKLTLFFTSFFDGYAKLRANIEPRHRLSLHF